MSKDIVYAACMVVLNDGKVLSVASVKHKNQPGLPGGKLNVGETPKNAAIRETEEETGIKVIKCHFIAGYGVDDGHLAYAYFADKWEGELKSSSEGVASWITVKKMLEGAFPVYNRKILKLVGII